MLALSLLPQAILIYVFLYSYSDDDLSNIEEIMEPFLCVYVGVMVREGRSEGCWLYLSYLEPFPLMFLFIPISSMIFPTWGQTVDSYLCVYEGVGVSNDGDNGWCRSFLPQAIPNHVSLYFYSVDDFSHVAPDYGPLLM